MHPRVVEVTQRLIERSRATRRAYLAMLDEAAARGLQRTDLPCANLAHGVASCSAQDKQVLRLPDAANVAIVSAYNDILSAHQPYEQFPEVIRQALREVGSVGQFAGGVPAMCDGVTQGEAGMELSLASREVIAMSTAVALSHNLFDAALYLGVCDKIVPGLLIGALRFGHLPALFVPAGPMPSGLDNQAKALVRQQFAEGKASREQLLASEMAAYHSAGTCTFYGTANTNQVLMEVMGLHLPGAAFVHPNTPLREALTREAALHVTRITRRSEHYRPLGRVVDERCIVNAVVALLATGGSTNHTLHLPAIARAAGIELHWEDMAQLSAVVPTLTHIYPSGKADINQFHAAGGVALVIAELLAAGLLHGDVLTVVGQGLAHYCQEPSLAGGGLTWRAGVQASLDESIVRPLSRPFSPEGGLRVLGGNVGRAVIKVSAVAAARHIVEAPARVFASQEQFAEAFKAGELERDVVVVMRFQGPRANGMPELHKLTPYLGLLQDRGFSVALVTDGRMSGASGNVPAAIHVCPEAACGGVLARVHDGDIIRVDARNGELSVRLSDEVLNSRACALAPEQALGSGRELFAVLRSQFSPASEGASVFSEGLALLK